MAEQNSLGPVVAALSPEVRPAKGDKRPTAAAPRQAGSQTAALPTAFSGSGTPADPFNIPVRPFGAIETPSSTTTSATPTAPGENTKAPSEEIPSPGPEELARAQENYVNGIRTPREEAVLQRDEQRRAREKRLVAQLEALAYQQGLQEERKRQVPQSPEEQTGTPSRKLGKELWIGVSMNLPKNAL